MMKVREQIIVLLISLAFGFGLTLRAVQWDASRLRQRRTEFALNLAKQITSQIETLTLVAESRKIKNPLDWATRIYALRPDEKARTAFKVTLISAMPSAKTQDQGVYDEGTGTLTYYKYLVAADGTALRVEVNLGFEGFLGAQNEFTQDLLKVICFALFSLGAGFVVKKGFLSSSAISEAQQPQQSQAA